MKKYIKWIVLGLAILILDIAIFVSFQSIKVKEFKNDDFKISYDTTWKVTSKDDGLTLKHKKSGSIFKAQVKEIDDTYLNLSLKDIISDVIYSIETQNEDYKLISQNEDLDAEYENYSYLYEKDDEQVLVRIYKADNKLLIIYFEADSKYYDIVLDSVDTMLESLEIYVGEKLS